MTMNTLLHNTARTPAPARGLRVVHLPFYDENPYQTLLINSLREIGIDAQTGGGGGNFFRSAFYRWQADILHFHWLHPYLLRETTRETILRGGRFLAEIAALKARGVRIVWTVHNLTNHDRRHARWERRLTRPFVRMCDGIVCHGEAVREGVLAAYGSIPPNRMSMIPHGDFLECYPNSISTDAARAALDLPPDAFVLTFVGRIQPYKGLEELVAVFREWDEPRARLLIAGNVRNSELRDQLTASTESDRRIQLHPNRVADDQLQVYLNAANSVILPFRDILTSSSAILAMSFGRTCIAPAVGCLPEHLGHDNILYGTENCPDLPAALRKSFQERDKLAEVGAANRRRVEQWSWGSVARKTCRLYETALQGSVAKPEGGK